MSKMIELETVTWLLKQPADVQARFLSLADAVSNCEGGACSVKVKAKPEAKAEAKAKPEAKAAPDVGVTRARAPIVPAPKKRGRPAKAASGERGGLTVKVVAGLAGVTPQTVFRALREKQLVRGEGGALTQELVKAWIESRKAA